MARFLFFLTALTFSSLSIAQDSFDCAPTQSEFQQCDFDIESLSNGEARVFPNTNQDNFVGAVAAACKAGNLILGKTSCKPANPEDCSVVETSWNGGSEDFCSHPTQEKLLRNGSELTVWDSSGKGKVQYACESGSLMIDSTQCGDSSKQKNNTNEFYGPLTKTQSASQKSYTFDLIFLSTYDHEVSPGSVMTEAVQKCSEIEGFDVRADVDYTFYDSADNYNYYTAHCPMVSSLRCDQDIIQGQTVGSPDGRGEFGNPPTYEHIKRVCTDRGYEALGDAFYVERTYPNTIDDYTVIAQCAGNTSSCSGGGGPLGEPEITEVHDCSTADVKSGLLKVPSGSVVTQGKVQAEVCSPLGFNSVENMTKPLLQDDSGYYQFYTVRATCGDYLEGDSNPLSSECDGNNLGGGSSVVDPLSCSSAEIKRQITGSYNPRNGEYTNEPTDAFILGTLCQSNEYNELDRVVSVERVDDISDLFDVTAICSAYTGETREDCETLGPCYGREVSATSQEPTIERNGKYYVDLCYNPDLPDDLCASCMPGDFEFDDKNTGNTCSIDVSGLESGENKVIEFANSDVNGVVDVFCNSSEKSVADSGIASCYKTCPGNVIIGWSDKNGRNSCSQRIPSGIYKHDEVVSLGESINHTGSASFRCDGVSGEWVRESGGSCKLDCNSELTWGSGTSNDGTNKSDLCANNTISVSHGANGTVSTLTSGTSGSASYTCNDGELSVGSASCNLGCSSEKRSWGGQCQGTVPSMGHGQSRSIAHSGNAGYAFSSTISGDASFSCNDGGLTQTSGSCRYVTSEGYENERSSSSKSCENWAPGTDSVDSGVRFTQTRSCTVTTRTYKDFYRYWNDGTKSFVRTDSNSSSSNVTETRPNVGTSRYLISEGWTGWSEDEILVSDSVCSDEEVGTRGPRGDVPVYKRSCALESVVRVCREYVKNYSAAPERVVTDDECKTETRTGPSLPAYCYTYTPEISIVTCPF